MLLGSIDTFAIETITEPSWCIPTAVWGRMRVWCCGVELGDYAERHCALARAHEGFAALRRNLPGLWAPQFAGLSDDALYDFLDAVLYGCRREDVLDDGRSEQQREADLRAWGKYIFLSNWGEQFDRSGKSFLVCPPGGPARILNRALPTAPLTVLHVAPADLVRATDAFLEWFESAEHACVD